MSGETHAVFRSWRVGSFVVTMTVPPVKPGAIRSVVIEWTPDVPAGLTADELAQYRAGRDAAIRSMGLTAVILDL